MLKKIDAGKDILKLADIFEPGLSVHRGKEVLLAAKQA